MTRGQGRRNQDRGAFGTVSKLPSGRYRALYYGPEGKRGRRYKAPTTFTTKREARKWLATVQADIVRGKWLPPVDQQPPAPRTKALTFRSYADEQWLPNRLVGSEPLKDRTREHYRKLLDTHILPVLGSKPIASITADDIRAWHAKLDRSTPTLRAHCYGLCARSWAPRLSDRKISAQPVRDTRRRLGQAGCHDPARDYRRAGEADRRDARAISSHDLVGEWCALRFGELTELRRKDVDIDDGIIRVHRGVVRAEGGFQVTTPKSDAGIRDVAIPPHLLPRCASTWSSMSNSGRMHCCSRRRVAAIWPRRRCTAAFIARVTRPDDPICAFTI